MALRKRRNKDKEINRREFVKELAGVCERFHAANEGEARFPLD